MSWSEARHLTERFQAIRHFLHQGCRHWKLGTSYEGWAAALGRETPRLVPWLLRRLRQAMRQLPGFQDDSPWIGFGVDGSDVPCPRTRANQAACDGVGQRDGTPQLLVTLLYHLRLGLPWALRAGPSSQSERGQLRQMLDELPAAAILVADAGFLGYALAGELMENRRPFLFRVGGNIHLLEDLGYATEVAGETVYLWPVHQQERQQPPVQLRLIVLENADQQPIYLVTNVLDPQRLPVSQASALYRARWGLEVFYRTTKQTMQHVQVRSRTPQRCYEEITWAILGVWLLGLMTMRQLAAAGQAVSVWSPAESRDVVRRVLRATPPDPRHRGALGTILAGCRKDHYARGGPKGSRHYPRKKRHQPPGPPKIKLANASQRQAAQQLTPLTTAG
jgi:hypothetical protein